MTLLPLAKCPVAVPMTEKVMGSILLSVPLHPLRTLPLTPLTRVKILLWLLSLRSLTSVPSLLIPVCLVAVDLRTHPPSLLAPVWSVLPLSPLTLGQVVPTPLI